MLERAARLPADLVLIDLEDSIAAGAKGDEARGGAVAALRGRDVLAPTVAVRVNPADTPICLADMTAVVGGAEGRLDVIVLPKVEDEGHLAFADHVLSALESDAGLPEGRIGLEAQIETARGLVAVERIAAAAPRRLEALVFGPGDMAASLGMPQVMIGAAAPEYPGDVWHHALSRIVTAARAFGLQAVDGPYAAVDDPDGLVASARRSRALGYDGKWSIHPSQVAPLNDVYGVPQADFDRALDIIDAHRRAASEGRGAVRLGGEMIDEATRKLAEGVVGRGRLAGLERSRAAE
jgi:citrate lyase subunit beta/citryl-CoA lyase